MRVAKNTSVKGYHLSSLINEKMESGLWSLKNLVGLIEQNHCLLI